MRTACYSNTRTSNSILSTSAIWFHCAWLVLFIFANRFENEIYPYLLCLILVQIFQFIMDRNNQLEMGSYKLPKYLIAGQIVFTIISWYYLETDYNNVVYIQSILGILFCGRVFLTHRKLMNANYILLHAGIFINVYLIFMSLIYKAYSNHPLELSISAIGVYICLSCCIGGYLPKYLYKGVDIYFEVSSNALGYLSTLVMGKKRYTKMTGMKLFSLVIIKLKSFITKPSQKPTIYSANQQNSRATSEHLAIDNHKISELTTKLKDYKKRANKISSELPRVFNNCKDNHHAISIVMDKANISNNQIVLIWKKISSLSEKYESRFSNIENWLSCNDSYTSTLNEEHKFLHDQYQFDISFMAQNIIQLKDDIKILREQISNSSNEVSRKSTKQAKRNRKRICSILKQLEFNESRLNIVKKKIPMFGGTSKIISEVTGMKQQTLDSFLNKLPKEAILGYGKSKQTNDRGTVYDIEIIAEPLFNRYYIIGNSKAEVKKKYNSVGDLKKALIAASSYFYRCD